MRIDVKRGLDLAIDGGPAAGAASAKSVSCVALLGREYPGLKLDLLAAAGDRVRAGEPVLHDRRRPGIVVTAPASGSIASVKRGARRSLLSVSITTEAEADDAVAFHIPAKLDKATVRRLLLESGLWTALRRRPFGHVPDPAAEPAALLITAIDTAPLSPDPAVAISLHAEHFGSGLEALTAICDARVYLCQAPGAAIPVGDASRVQVVEFSGPHPAGLPGTHIHALCPIGFNGSEVWHIGYQDVIALGYLVNTAGPWLQRVVALAGPAIKRPRLLTVPLAASTDELTAGELNAAAVRNISGSVLSGYSATGAEAFLGQRHNQLTALPEASAANRSSRDGGWNTGLGGRRGPMIPSSELERLAPPGILAVPMMRALLVGDIERARDLGALELVEEDLALLTYACTSKHDYGRLLREVLDQLVKEAV